MMKGFKLHSSLLKPNGELCLNLSKDHYECHQQIYEQFRQKGDLNPMSILIKKDVIGQIKYRRTTCGKND